MKKVLIALSALAFLGLGGCAGTQAQPTPGAAKSGADKAIAEAEKEVAAANKSGHPWKVVDKATGRSSATLEKLLEAAKKARDAGDAAEATRIANRVADVARMGQRQAKEQADAGPFYPK